MAKDESVTNIFIIFHHIKHGMQSYFLKENMICYLGFIIILHLDSSFSFQYIMLFDHSDTKLFFSMAMLQLQCSHHTMQNKGGKKKRKVHEEDSDVEVFPRMEIIYEDIKAKSLPNPAHYKVKYA